MFRFGKLGKLALLIVLLFVVGLPIVANAQEGTEAAPTEAAPIIATEAVQAVLDAVESGDVPVILVSDDASQDSVPPVVVEVANDDWSDTASMVIYGVLFVAGAIILYLVKQNAALSDKLRDYLPSGAWQSIYDAGAKTALDYAARTPNKLDDEVAKLIAQQLASILKVQRE